MYLVLDKEKEGSIRGLNLAMVRFMAIQLTAVLEQFNKLRLNLLHKMPLALTCH
jgi:hypothetical protein